MKLYILCWLILQLRRHWTRKIVLSRIT